ncbi:TPA: hypothetical protein MCG37_004303 [Klebsiella pneumoniae]|uniref:hypothetical protein n=1 Tax=Klebsiella TaxID=570 RepID=UPI00053921BB|nr:MULTISPECIES: hypothetical protein [Klebsiella]HDT3954310.1 hypothetical protein [Klebsiella pneumoniae subsp. pneumoniae]EKT9259621.1 hypothetical protein [Klebsiella pneumoniae]EKW8331096.1 hypothetical protein [Klebsiella pneumoniae]ELA2159980.1 hypothetical protein [Klebsiella pneumoniae]ELB5597673.1 hypothetical protein [Klebsiella pneumoniae]
MEKADSEKNRYDCASFEEAAKPLIKWLNENANPHASVTVDCTSAQLLTGEIGIHTEEFIKD